MIQRSPCMALAAILLAAAAAACTGCKTADMPASASFASVEITGHTPEQIRAATVVVFQQDGYTSSNERAGDLVFEKEASHWDRIAYGNWIDDAAVWIRVKASVVPAANGSYRLQCQAYRVRNKGDHVFEDEVRIRNSHRKPYQALLDQVARQMKG